MKHRVKKILKDLIHKTPYLEKNTKVAVGKFALWKDDKKYIKWLKYAVIRELNTNEQIKLLSKFQYKPLISIITPTYNTPEKFLREMINSVINQSYINWELVIVDDSSSDDDVRKVIQHFAKQDHRIKYRFLDRNLHIAGATNEAIKMSSGKFVGFLDHDDLLLPNALFEIIKALNNNKELDFIYSDEDKIVDGNSTQPFFKPDWNPDFLYSVNYITHFTVIRKSFIDRIGYESDIYNGAQDWELFLRATSYLNKEKICHIPKILYSWRVHDLSTAKDIDAKPYVIKAQRQAIESSLKAHSIVNFKLDQDEVYRGQWKLSFVQKTKPIVSIFVSNDIATQVLANIKAHTNYQKYETFVLKSDTSYGDILDKINGKYLVIITKKININEPNWIEFLLGDASRKDIGFVLTALNTDKDTIQLIGDLINETAISLINSVSRRNTAKHLYCTARYNIRTIYKGAAMIEVDKLRKLTDNQNKKFCLIEASRMTDSCGYRNLYNPYIKIIR